MQAVVCAIMLSQLCMSALCLYNSFETFAFAISRERGQHAVHATSCGDERCILPQFYDAEWNLSVPVRCLNQQLL